MYAIYSRPQTRLGQMVIRRKSQIYCRILLDYSVFPLARPLTMGPSNRSRMIGRRSLVWGPDQEIDHQTSTPSDAVSNPAPALYNETSPSSLNPFSYAQSIDWPFDYSPTDADTELSSSQSRYTTGRIKQIKKDLPLKRSAPIQCEKKG